MQCPKEAESNLVEGALSHGLNAHICPSCQGTWIPPENYENWRSERIEPDAPVSVNLLPSALETDFKVSPFDNRAALCPDCKHYLVRGKVNLKDQSFFIERCPNCKGIWCDRGEWSVLEALGLDTQVGYIFLNEWQNKVRELESLERERRATIEKLGPDLADKLFALAQLLEEHPYGDFGVAYLMRRFDQ